MNNGGFGTGHTSDNVLIDTWWNVNLQKPCSPLLVKCVLIDTWWNVNINFSGKMAQMTTVLIDTWWNVNLFHLRIILVQ